LAAVPLFGTLAVIGPSLMGIAPWPASAILLLIAGDNLLAAVMAGGSRTVRQLDAVGIGVQLSTGLLLMVLFVATGTFIPFAAPSLMAAAVFAFGVSRHPFRNAVAISAGHIVLYLAFAVAIGWPAEAAVNAVILAAAVGAACIGTYAAERGERQLYTRGLIVDALKDRLDELLHRYIAPGIADTLLADPQRTELGGEEVEVTALFADLAGFTSFSERVRPEEGVEMLNSAFGPAIDIVHQEGGTIVHFAGDAFLAIFNAPLRQDDHAMRAARTALRVQGEHDRGTPPDTLRFRVGVNTGPALIGNVGSATLRTFTAIGDAVNLAARLQTLAAPGTVVLGERTTELLGKSVVVRPLGEAEVKGKELPVRAFQLLRIPGTGLDGVLSREPG
jgi:class 3 adenylate cyclase